MKDHFQGMQSFKTTSVVANLWQACGSQLCVTEGSKRFTTTELHEARGDYNIGARVVPAPLIVLGPRSPLTLHKIIQPLPPNPHIIITKQMSHSDQCSNISVFKEILFFFKSNTM